MEESTLSIFLQHLLTQYSRTMATNFFHKLVLATASVTFGLNVCSSLSATAATVTYDFSNRGFTGSFSYDDSLASYFPATYFSSLGSSDSNPNPPETIPCASYSSAEPLPPYCVSRGSFVPLTDFQVNVNGNVFTKSDAQTFNIIWQRDIPVVIARPFLFTYTGLLGAASFGNPYPQLFFYTYPFGGTQAGITEIGGRTQYLGGVSFNLRNIEPTSVPEGQQELALLGLGLVGLISLLKKKLSFFQHN